MCDPQKLSVLDELRNFLGIDVRAVVTTERDIVKALERYYAVDSESVETIIADLEDDVDLAAAAASMEKDGPLDLTSVEALADSAPVRKLLNMVFLLAIKDEASDLHFEPFENEFKIRIRADGVLYEMVPPPRHLAFAITTRIKGHGRPRHRRAARAPGTGESSSAWAGTPSTCESASCPPCSARAWFCVSSTAR